METQFTRPSAQPKTKQRRGFAVMEASLRQEIARKGGKAAHALGRAHEFTRDEARIAGQKGGLAKRARSESLDH